MWHKQHRNLVQKKIFRSKNLLELVFEQKKSRERVRTNLIKFNYTLLEISNWEYKSQINKFLKKMYDYGWFRYRDWTKNWKN